MPIGQPRLPNQRTNCGLTKIEVIAVVAVLILLAIFFSPLRYTRASRVKCSYNLKNVGLAFRIFSTDNEDKFPMDVPVAKGGAWEFGIGTPQTGAPVYAYFRALSNEISTPKDLICPWDTRKPVKDFNSLISNTNVSYFVALGVKEAEPSTVLVGDGKLTYNGLVKSVINLNGFQTNEGPILGWAQGLHGTQSFHGNVVMADGSVQQLNAQNLNRVMYNASLHSSNQTLLLPYQSNGKW